LAQVSVLLPVRDAASTLAQCLASLRSQTLRDHEVIAVDDGSKDESPRLLEEAARLDPRVVVIRTRSLGIVSALNTALDRAQAPLVARMDADDYAHTERLARQAARLAEDPAIAILGCRVGLFGKIQTDGMRSYLRWQNDLVDHDSMVRDIWVEAPLAHPSLMMPARVLRDLGGYREFEGPEDYDLWLRAHTQGLRFGKLRQTLLFLRDSPGRLTRTDPRYSAERFRALKIEALGQGALRDRRGVVVWGAGPIGKGWARALEAAGTPVVAFVEVDSRKIGRLIHGARVVGVSGAAAFLGPLHLAAVGQAGARQTIREAARALGLTEGRDFLAVA